MPDVEIHNKLWIVEIKCPAKGETVEEKNEEYNAILSIKLENSLLHFETELKKLPFPKEKPLGSSSSHPFWMYDEELIKSQQRTWQNVLLICFK